MNNHQTIEKLRVMRLGAMASLHRQCLDDGRIDSMGPDEYLALLTDHQWEDRANRKIERLIKRAGFRTRASLAEVDYTPGVSFCRLDISGMSCRALSFCFRASL